MTGGGYPPEEAAAAYARWLPMINYENRQCGFATAKILMKEGGVIRSEAVRSPVQPVHRASARDCSVGRAGMDRITA